MVVVKIEYEGDIRRVTIEEDKSSFKSLVELVTDLFQQSLPPQWVLKYKDDDGDFISVTCDRELSEALAVSKPTAMLRFFVKATKTSAPQSVAPISPTTGPKPVPTQPVEVFKPVHPAICDNCNKRVVGIRFKCAICPDYDLCETCNNLGTIHKHHSFARIFSPTEKHFITPFTATTTTTAGGPPAAPLFKTKEEEASPSKTRYFSRFIKDITYEDGTRVLAGSKFVKTWRLRNNGANAWPEGTCFVNIGGDFMGKVESVPVGSAAPNEEVDISVEIEAPRIAGRYVSNWRLGTPCGIRFGHKVWVDIIVVEAEKEVEPVKETEKEKEKEKEEEPKETEEKIEPIPVVVEKKEEGVKEKKVDDDIPDGPLRQKLIELYDMGFTDRALNRRLLVKCKGDLLATVHELLKA